MLCKMESVGTIARRLPPRSYELMTALRGIPTRVFGGGDEQGGAEAETEGTPLDPEHQLLL